MSDSRASFAERVLRWQSEHGRQHLPWQASRDPYRVWLSEIMLQQTQVSTVLGYYERFLQQFPTVEALAQASLDEVLALWSGLGYYSRARNLHRCAQAVVQQHAGRFPGSAQQLADLPGIGRSTASAIASFCFGERAAILDGNVKRVLARHAGFAEDLSQARHVQALWDLAQARLPTRALSDAMPRYTQGMMDLGAMICTARAPQCHDCPVRRDCAGLDSGNPLQFPVKTRKLRRSAETLWVLLALNANNQLWLVPRPPSGIWGGLYAPALFDGKQALLEAAGIPDACAQEWPSVKHVLTHKDLYLHPVVVQVDRAPQTADQARGQWFDASQALGLGLPAPVRKLIEGLTERPPVLEPGTAA